MSFKPDTECRVLGGNFYTYKHKKSWQLIYYHDFSQSGAWERTTDALNSKDIYKYSILDTIDETYSINNRYEFLLEYPETTGYNMWSQANFPLNEIKAEDKRYAIDYKPLHISWSSQGWGGLFKSSTGETLIAGSCGMLTAWYGFGRTGAYEGGVPGPGLIVNKTLLWIRVSSHDEKSCIRQYKNQHPIPEFLHQ